MPSFEVCKIIKRDEIDVLIDLAGHTNGNSAEVMASKPAPITMTYLGYPNTTGLCNMNYRITDQYADPLGTTQVYSEKLLRMPKCFICFSPHLDIEKFPITYTPTNYIVFAVFNKINKQNNATFRAWIEILNRVPNAILLIKRDIKAAFDERFGHLMQMGETNRIQISEHIVDRADYYNTFNKVDICLDTFPYSGTTTSCDTFTMSTPVITLSFANRHVSNVTRSMLINMNFPELVAYSIDEYIAKAIELAHNPDKIMYYKQHIRNAFTKLMNGKQFTQEFCQLISSVY
jgi:predicted O-linked N-acetylglucosamine transferase (SPINDLY family)